MRWAGQIGYARQAEIKPGIWEDVITEVDAQGELKQVTEALDSGSTVLPQYRTTTSVSVITDGRQVPISSMRYIVMGGLRFQIASAIPEPPRVTLYVGEEYRGPFPE